MRKSAVRGVEFGVFESGDYTMTIAADHLESDFWGDYTVEEDFQAFSGGTTIDVNRLIHQHSPLSRPNVLDLGCGAGHSALAFARAGFRVTVADPSLRAISHVSQRAAREGLFIRTAVCDMRQDMFLPESFDIILAISHLFHYPERIFAENISRVRHWLKPQGLLYLTCPTTEDGLYGKGSLIDRDTYEFEPGHVHFHASRERLGQLLQGFHIRSLHKHECRWYDEALDVPHFSSRWQVLGEKIP